MGNCLPAKVAGIVAVAAALAGYLALTLWQAPLAVTDVSAPGSASHLVASGEVGNASWQIIVRPSPYVGQPGQVYWFGHGPAFGFPGSQCENTPEECGGLRTPPVALGDIAPPGPGAVLQLRTGAGAAPLQVARGTVGADVTSVVLRLDDGQQLKLIPVKRDGYRLVAFVIPRQMGIASATAYLSNSQYATTIPSSNNGLSFFLAWLWHSPRRHGPRATTER